MNEISREQSVNKVFSMVAGVPDPETGIALPGTGVAEPGDLVFFVTHRVSNGTKPLTRFFSHQVQPWKRKFLGFAKNDFDEWHVGIYLMGKKRSRHKRMNLWILHSHAAISEIHFGVHRQHISPRYLDRMTLDCRPRIEILTYQDMTQEKRQKIIDHAGSMIGLEFDMHVVKHSLLTYIFGLPNILHNRNKISCQQLAIDAYAAAGISFPHPYGCFPKWNIGRILRRPLGHPKDRVNPKYPYLMDHHLYRDPRFLLKAALYRDPHSAEIKLETENLRKYSWLDDLRDKYLGDGSAH